MTDPTIEAARSIVDERLAELHAALEGATPQMLNWRPAGPDSNPPGVLAVHALGATRHWLSLAVGAPPPARDRDSEFRTEVDDADALLRWVDETSADVRAILDDATGFDPGAVRAAEDVTAAWALIHAVEHLQEHVGHLELTRQLWSRREEAT
jgi:Protein of unknown function (DUF664)